MGKYCELPFTCIKVKLTEAVLFSSLDFFNVILAIWATRFYFNSYKGWGQQKRHNCCTENNTGDENYKSTSVYQTRQGKRVTQKITGKQTFRERRNTDQLMSIKQAN